MRIVKYCICGDRELIVTVFAVEDVYVIHESDYRTKAAQALRTVRPAQALQQLAATVVISERGAEIDNRHREHSNGCSEKEARAFKGSNPQTSGIAETGYSTPNAINHIDTETKESEVISSSIRRE
jgi:hypothetical protein